MLLLFYSSLHLFVLASKRKIANFLPVSRSAWVLLLCWIVNHVVKIKLAGGNLIITINISSGGDTNAISKSETFDNITKPFSPPIQSYGVMVSTTVFGAVGPSSNLGKTTK